MKAGKEKSLATNKDLLESTLRTLTRCKYFSTMSKDVLRMVLQVGKYIESPAGKSLIKEGALDDDLFFLLSGSLKVLSGGALILRLDQPGDIVGEFAVVSSAPRSADVITDSPSKLVRVSSSMVKESSRDSKLTTEFLTVFAHIMAAKLTETSSRARLYEHSVLETQELTTSHTKLETEIQEKLDEIRLYSKIIESSSDAVMVTDMEGLVIKHNPAALKLFKQLDLPTKLYSKNIQDLTKGFELGGFPVATPQQGWNGEWHIKSGSKNAVLQVSANSIIGKGEKPEGVAYQLRDITLQKNQEEAILTKNDEVKNALLNLESTYQELQRSDKLKTETLNVISEELASPIRRILNHSGKIKQSLGDLEPKELDRHVNFIYNQSEQLRVISENINYLLELQIEFQQRNLMELDLREVIQKSVTDLTDWAAQKNITFKVKFPDEPLRLTGDREQLATVFNLLLEQALVVSKSKSTLGINVSYQEKSNQIRIFIEYQGPDIKSIAPEESPDRGRMGMMIGLPLARKVISQYQGSLQFGGDKDHGEIVVLIPPQQKFGEDRPNRIMLVDQSDMDRMIAKGVIDHLWVDSVIMSTNDPFEFLDNYEDFQPDLVIIDPAFSESGWSNHRVLASLFSHRRHIAPILSISGLYKDFAERTIAVERGVSDFLAKPYSIFDLRFKVKSLLQSHRKELSMTQNMDQVQRLAYTDALTRLPNRKHFDEFLETQVEYSRQTLKSCALIMLDVDHFKHYNDHHGHQLGDEVLKQVSRILEASVRASDLPARYGGEEFAVVLPETSKEMANVIAEKVRRTMEEAPFLHAEDQPLGYLSASFGVASFREDADSAETLLRVADTCLYQAKDEGRNRIVVASKTNPAISRAKPASSPGARKPANRRVEERAKSRPKPARKTGVKSKGKGSNGKTPPKAKASGS